MRCVWAEEGRVVGEKKKYFFFLGVPTVPSLVLRCVLTWL